MSSGAHSEPQYEPPGVGSLSECDVAPFATFGKADAARWARIQERWSDYSDLTVEHSSAHHSTAVVTSTSTHDSARRKFACHDRHNPLRFETFWKVCVVPIRREVEWRWISEDERALEDLYKANKDVPWERRLWKVSYERTTHASAVLAFQRCILPVERNEHRWDWSDEGMHDLRIPYGTEKYGPVPWGVEVWVYRKFNFLMEEAYQAALETVGFWSVLFGGISDIIPGGDCSIPG